MSMKTGLKVIDIFRCGPAPCHKPETENEKALFPVGLDEFVNPSVYCSLHDCRSKTTGAHWEPQRQLHGNASRRVQTNNGQPSSYVTRDDESRFLIMQNFCQQGLEQTVAVSYSVPKILARQNASNFGAVPGLV